MARTKKKIVCKEPIKLWFKPLPSGNRSIYLFIRRGTKKEYEHLNLILIPETDQISKLRNEQTLQLARRIHAERILTLNSEEHGFVNTSSKSKVNLIMYIEKLANDNFERTGTKRGYNENILCLKRHLIEYYGTDQIPFKTVNESFVRGFISYLREAKNMSCNPPNRPLLAQNTRHKLYAQLKTVISHALRDSII